MKTCITCEISKKSSEFQNHTQTPDGLSVYCRSCIATKRKNRTTLQKARTNNQMRAWRKANADEVKAKKAAAYKADAERVKANAKAYRDANAIKIKTQRRLHYLETKEAMRPKRAEIFAAKKKRTPKWLTHADKLAMISIYEESARLTKCSGVKHEVDHIIPLQGKTVSGLHVPNNLQILTQYDNRRKGNSY